MNDTRKDIDNLKHLGSQGTAYPTEYSASILERIDARKFAKNVTTTVKLDCPEFTSLCPKTGQPDFAHITISYKPDLYLVESKALKLYLFSFRNMGEFHEDCIARICNDIYQLILPEWITVTGDFYPRGGIKICPETTMSKNSAYL
jgi:7-cyano-7-deazaguanine reductase